MTLRDIKLGAYIQTFAVLDADLADNYANKLVNKVLKIAKTSTKLAYSPGFLPYKGTKGFYIPKTTIDWNLPN